MPSESLREQLEQAYDEKEPEEVGGPEEDTEESVGTAAAEKVDTKLEEKGGDGDDDAKKPDAIVDEEPAKKAAGEEDAGAADTAVDVKTPVPASWKPAVREHWGKLPPEVRAEVSRRETEIQNGLREASDARKFVEEFNGVIRPFEGMIAAEGHTPLQSIQGIMTSVAGLNMGSPQQRAGIVANVIRQYSVDVAMLDSMLSGEAPDAATSGMQEMIQRELGPIRQFMSGIGEQQRGHQERLVSDIQSEMDAFSSDPENEFFEDVRDTMADFMEIAARKGETMDLKTAYDRACRMDESVSNVLSARAKAEAAETNRVTTIRKKEAASSLSPAAGSDAGDKSPETIRETLTEAWDDAS